eukprot:scaffold217701_cov35-Tisochrysis_lutea.AAC.4
MKVSVPALCYTVQNNLQFVAASHLGAALLQLLYQTKTLSTAIFGVIILSKSLRCNQWLALMVLVAGVVTAQWSQQGAGGELAKGDVMTGVLAALGVSICSGFASVYLEKILKGTPVERGWISSCGKRAKTKVPFVCAVYSSFAPPSGGLS